MCSDQTWEFLWVVIDWISRVLVIITELPFKLLGGTILQHVKPGAEDAALRAVGNPWLWEGSSPGLGFLNFYRLPISSHVHVVVSRRVVFLFSQFFLGHCQTKTQDHPRTAINIAAICWIQSPCCNAWEADAKVDNATPLWQLSKAVCCDDSDLKKCLDRVWQKVGNALAPHILPAGGV